ncbi:MAG TPA: type II secretion system F family protein [Candidatus Anammoximicrobium sp.]|nr:type II secretion system F family protein [Candidatus Anammoximicrobium sp.]
MSPVMIVVAFLAGFFLIFAINYALADVAEAHRLRAKKRLEEEFRDRQKELARKAVAQESLHLAAADGMARQMRKSWRERLVNLINEAGIAMRPDQLLVACACFGVVAFLPCVFVWDRWTLGVLVGLAASPLPLAYIAWLRRKRLQRILSQLPGAFDLMARTMRAGQTIGQSFQAVADEGPRPISEEFGFCYEQQNLGLSPEAAMYELSRRTGLLELKIFVMAVMIHRQTGGNLSELLDKLGGVIRERAKLRGTIRALTAEGLLQAYVLIGLPPAILAVMWFINRPYAEVFFQEYYLLISMAVSMSIGWFWMRRIVNFDF